MIVDRLSEKVRVTYENRAKEFFERLSELNLTDAELNAVPSLFLPGWGEDYDSSFPKIVVAGKETLTWSNEYTAPY